MKISKNKLDISQIKFLDSNNYRFKNGNYYLKKVDLQILSAVLDIKNLTKNKEFVLIAIDGMSGSGKSTLSKRLAKYFDANLFRIDDFFKKPEITETPFSQYGNNINFKLIENNIINKITKGKSVTYQPFNFKTHSHEENITVGFNNINIIEGSFSHHPYLDNYYHYKIFLKTNCLKQRLRIYKRSGFKRLINFIKVWIPNENVYFKNLKIETKANKIIKT